MTGSPDRTPARLAVVTGASGGLGSRLARHLLARGWHVDMWSRRRPELSAELLCRYPDAVRWLPVDVTDVSSISTAAKSISGNPQLELLVNNAGVLHQGLFVTESPDATEQTIQVNLVGALHVTKACARLMLGAGGVVINISSINAIRGHRGVASYSAAKAGLSGLTSSLARELGADGVRVNTIVPGYFASELSSTVTEDNLERIRRRTPLGRLGTVEDIIPALDYLISPGASFVTGQTLTIDGGLTC